MKTVSEISAAIVVLNVFQIQELDKVIKLKMSSFGLPDRTVTPIAPFTDGLDVARRRFKVGDVVEFFSTRTHANVKVRIEKINSVNLSCRAIDAPFTKWRVAPSFCRLVGADKPPAATVSPIPASAIAYGAMTSGAGSTAAGAGAW